MKTLTFLTAAFPGWVLVASLLALFWPHLFTWFNGPLITIGLGVIMLSMGMTLKFEDFRRIARNRYQVLPGIVLQYTVMPALGWSLSYLFALPTPFAVGLILVSCCPGGTASNVIAFLARADVALSVTMTSLSTLLAVALTPTLTALLAGSRVDVPVGGLLLSTVQIVILPIIAGVSVNRYLPSATKKLLPIAPLVAVVMITLIVASVIGSGRQQVLDAGFRLVMAVFSLHTAGFMFGYLGGQLLIGQILTSRTISIEVGMQNSGLGVVLAQQNFASPLVAIPSAISSVFHSLIGSLIAAVWRTFKVTEATLPINSREPSKGP